VVVSSTTSLRYDDGKMLKGTGTLASKSRVTAVRERLGDLDDLSSCYINKSKGETRSKALVLDDELMKRVDEKRKRKGW
jgi:hypothetical protein